MGTNPNAKCAVTPARNDEPTPDAWPLDFDDNQSSDVLDMATFSTAYGSVFPGPLYNKRYDFNGDGHIDVLDTTKFSGHVGEDCTP